MVVGATVVVVVVGEAVVVVVEVDVVVVVVVGATVVVVVVVVVVVGVGLRNGPPQPQRLWARQVAGLRGSVAGQGICAVAPMRSMQKCL